MEVGKVRTHEAIPPASFPKINTLRVRVALKKDLSTAAGETKAKKKFTRSQRVEKQTIMGGQSYSQRWSGKWAVAG